MTSPVKSIQTPLTDAVIQTLRTGDSVLISGVLYTARDTAHKRMIESIRRGDEPPIPLQNQILFYAGPAPAPPGKPVGSIGPTTACRMDGYTIPLLQLGLKGMIGKGARSAAVRAAIQTHRAVYFAAIGGTAALLARRVLSSEIVAYEDLGPEAIRRLEVNEFPVIVVNDCYGADLYEEGVAAYRID
jgi:fumarate hydratase subunit beta